MFFFFCLTSFLGGLIAATTEDDGVALLGIALIIVSSLGAGYVGFPGA